MSKELTLNPRQKKFLKFYVQSGNAAASAEKAGYKFGEVQGSRLLSNVRLQEAYQHLLDKNGITDKALIGVLSEGLKANKTISAYSSKEADEKTNDFIDVPDYAVRHKYLETGLKLKKRIGDDSKNDDAKQPVTVAVQILHVRRTADLPSPEKRKGDKRNLLVSEAGEGDGQHGEITSLVRRVQVG